ncbi:MAG: NADH-quinone oxidoreductase subunit L, partial [Proteobacteria bacterium]|nr:NADH-quinone oxidoreductase subunit L [Pseudomonadota bacterium]
MSEFFVDTNIALTFICVALPVISFGLIMLVFRYWPKVSLAVSLICSTVPMILSVYLLAANWGLSVPLEATTYWLFSAHVKVPFGLYLDPLSLLMLCIVCIVSWLIQVYSIGYMRGDPGFSRYYACLSLFAWAMITMVVSNNMLQFYIFWELVGLASYLLIGFWYQKPEAAVAGKKAFVVTRFGDIGFFLGLIILFLHVGNLYIGQIITPLGADGHLVFGPWFGDLFGFELGLAGTLNVMTPTLVTISSLLIFCGVMGKSAQFPLLTWLPDAMEGPTPVSALLHSATMVAAGVYLFARIFPFFAASETTMLVALAIGTVTMLMSSTMALNARDLKQVWAYSTVSQLGFMVMALAAGGYFSGVFHLTTHAGFKAMLFLSSGVFIHAFHSNDMFEISAGGGARKNWLPMITMSVGALALAGIFPFSGFFSKEAIMKVLADKGLVWLIAGLLGAFLTAYYSFRLIFIMWFPRGDRIGTGAHEAPLDADDQGQIEDAAHGGHEKHHGHEWVMEIPLIILALATIGLGFFEGAIHHFIGDSHVPGHAAAAAHGAAAHGGSHAWLLYAALGSALAGILLAYWEWGRPGARRKGFIEYLPAVANFFDKRWYLDHFWRGVLDRLIYGVFSRFFTLNDRRIIDGGVDAVSQATIGGGWLLSRLQSAQIQRNLMLSFVVVAGLGL